MKLRHRSLIVSVLIVFFIGLGSVASLPETAMAQAGDPVFVGAGDIANCNKTTDDSTAQLLDSIAGTVFTLGDNAYPNGTLAEFNNCYGPTWGRHKNRTKPSPGNHDYHVSGAAGYFDYFGAAAGDRTKGYYSYNLGTWHIIALNSEIDHSAGSAQEQWLRADLAANPSMCTLAYWHKALFGSGMHGNIAGIQPLWQALYDYGADVVVNAHDHLYERLAPQNPSGQADASRGIREFIVGTGGGVLYPWSTIHPNSQARNNTTWGVLKLTLHSTSYDWQFIPIAGQTFTDSGSSNCVGSGPVLTPTPTSIPTRPPVATTLTSPSGNITSPYPIYTWSAVLNGAQGDAATWYLLRVKKADNSVAISQWYQASSVCPGSTCSAQPSTALTGGVYTWEVQTWNNGGYGPWSSPMSFTLPFLPGKASSIAPSGNITSSQPTFSWNISPDGSTTDPATWYYLWVKKPSGDPIKIWYQASAICSSSSCSATPAVTLTGGNYTWWVQSWNSTGYGPWSDGMNFSLPVPKPPVAATLTSPSGSIPGTNPTYTWDAVPDSAQGDAATWYYLWVKRPSGEPIKIWYDASVICNVGTCSVTPAPTLGSGAHTWWIQTWNSTGYGPWSSGMNFTVGP